MNNGNRFLIDLRSLIVFLFLIPVFLVNIQVGHNNLFLRFHYLLYPLTILSFLFFTKDKNLAIKLVLTLLFLFWLNMVYALCYASDSIMNGKAILATGSSLSMLGSAFIVGHSAKPSFLFMQIEKFGKLTIFLILISFTSYKFTGVPFLHELGYGYGRPQAFMSEPSALAFILSFMVGFYYIKKNYFWFVLSVTSVILVQSLVVLLSTVAVFVFVVVRNVLKTKNPFLGIFFLLLAIVVGLVVYNILLIYYSHQIERLELGIKSAMTYGYEGNNPRVTVAIHLIESVYSKGGEYLGLGLNANSYTDVNTTRWKESTAFMPGFIFMSYGYVGLLFIYLYLIYVAIKGFSIVDRYEGLYLLYISLLVMTSLTGAQGLLIYALLLAVSLCTLRVLRTKK